MPSIEGKVDRLLGLKENVIIGKLIPAATGLKQYRQHRDRPVRAAPASMFARPEARGELLAALEEIGDGDGIDLDALGLQLDESAPSRRRCRGARAARRRDGLSVRKIGIRERGSRSREEP